MNQGGPLVNLSTSIYAHSFSPTGLTFDLPASFRPGYYTLWTMSNAVPSTAVIILVPANCWGPFTFTFTDPVLTPRVTVIRAVHIIELRSDIDTLRSDAGLSASVWTDPTLTPRTSTIRAAHVAEMRTALSAVYTTCGQSAPSYTDPTLTAGQTVVRSKHIDELRTGVNGAK